MNDHKVNQVTGRDDLISELIYLSLRKYSNKLQQLLITQDKRNSDK